MQLGEQARQSFATNGYVIIRQALKADIVAELLDRADRLIDSDERFFRSTDGEFDGFRNLLFLDQGFLRLIDVAPVLVPVLQILGCNVHLSSLHLAYVHPRDRTRVWRGDWHTDIFGFEDDLREHTVRVGIKCAFALTRHREANTGTTILLPGSHKSARQPALDRHDSAPVGAVQPELEPGDCLLFENRLRHSRGINDSDRTRKSILVGYSYRWVMPLDSLDGFELPPDDASAVARDLLPRPYGVPGNDALRALCAEVGLPPRPARIL